MTYRTAQIAEIVGVHPNTIRFYERVKLLPPIPRTANGYRVFGDWHLLQLRLLRAAFRAEIISDSLRQEVFEIVTISASGLLEEAIHRTHKYRNHIREEKARAEEAIRIANRILENTAVSNEQPAILHRVDAAVALGITKDILRDWERNGLIDIPRSASGYRTYGCTEMNRLKIIRTLRNAHYSMMSILRMLTRMDRGEKNLGEILNTPGDEEDIVCAADRYCSSLSFAENDAEEMLGILAEMQDMDRD